MKQASVTIPSNLWTRIGNKRVLVEVLEEVPPHRKGQHTEFQCRTPSGNTITRTAAAARGQRQVVAGAAHAVTTEPARYLALTLDIERWADEWERRAMMNHMRSLRAERDGTGWGQYEDERAARQLGNAAGLLSIAGQIRENLATGAICAEGKS